MMEDDCRALGPEHDGTSIAANGAFVLNFMKASAMKCHAEGEPSKNRNQNKPVALCDKIKKMKAKQAAMLTERKSISKKSAEP